MHPRLVAGIAAAAGSLVGLVAGAAIGSRLEKGEGQKAMVAGASLGGVLGMMLGAAAGAVFVVPTVTIVTALPAAATPAQLPSPAPVA